MWVRVITFKATVATRIENMGLTLLMRNKGTSFAQRVTCACETHHREIFRRDGHCKRDKDHIPYTKGRQTILRPNQNAVSLTPCNDAATPDWHRWTPFSFAIVSQGVVPCYHHMASIS